MQNINRQKRLADIWTPKCHMIINIPWKMSMLDEKSKKWWSIKVYPHMLLWREICLSRFNKNHWFVHHSCLCLGKLASSFSFVVVQIKICPESCQMKVFINCIQSKFIEGIHQKKLWEFCALLFSFCFENCFTILTDLITNNNKSSPNSLKSFNEKIIAHTKVNYRGIAVWWTLYYLQIHDV